MSTTPARAIVETRLAARYGRPALGCPSGRLALYLALTGQARPGGRVLMSPLTDDVVAFVVLAAGLRPVFAPIDTETGNIAVDEVGDGVWADVDVVLTTNLYGVPENSAALRAQCDRHDAVLIEDIAHGLPIDDADGQPLGHQGDAIIVSLSKHGRGQGGGALITRDAGALAEARRRVEPLLRSPRSREQGRTMLGRLIRGTRFQTAPTWARRTVGRPVRVGHRMAVKPLELRGALERAPDLEAFDAWIGIDRRRYRDTPDAADAVDAARSLDRAEDETAIRRSGTAALCDLPAASAGARRARATPLFRVPLLVADRGLAEHALRAVGHPLHYLYDPPLDALLSSEFADPSPGPEAARWWATHALPVDPLAADQVLDAVHADPGAFTVAPSFDDSA